MINHNINHHTAVYFKNNAFQNHIATTAYACRFALYNMLYMLLNITLWSYPKGLQNCKDLHF